MPQSRLGTPGAAIAARRPLLRRTAALGLVAAASVLLAACGGGSGAATVENPGGGPPGNLGYTGPAPATADVQSFKLNLWDNISGNNRCGSCHGADGGQSPLFARADDINLAYGEANGIVTLTAPEDSLMVIKVAGGHNCWLSSSAACADILATWITNWAGTVGGSAGRKIDLEPPALRDPGASKSFPEDPGLFQTHVYPLLRQHCSTCHSSASPAKQSPFFAEEPASDPNAIATAYAAAKARMNLDDPPSSRFVVRVRDESHNCWTASCTSDGGNLADAIAAFANQIQPTEVDPNLVTSKALTLYEGTIASGGNRYESSVIALYEFKTGAGTTAFDTSGVQPEMHLTLSGSVEWFGGWGLNFSGGKAQASTASSQKLRTMITATGEYSIEAWVTPGNVVQEDVRIVSYSAGTTARNFNLGQTMYNYDFFNRSSNSDANGNPQLSTPDAAEVLQATLQHVVATYHPAEGRKIYVNGVLASMQDPVPGGVLTDWDPTYAFVLGNEVSGSEPFTGVIRLVAVHNRALSEPQILQNFEAGVGEKFFLLFGVEHLTNVPQSFVVMEGSVFDSYAYLFRNPFFVSLDGTAEPNGIDVEGIRIGLNGGEARVGQSFAKVDTTISSQLYTAETGQPLATLGAVVPLEKGPDFDEFFLTFDRLGANTYNRPPLPTPIAPAPQDLPAVSDVGVRTFDEIHASLAVLTGVSALDGDVQDTLALVRQSMPSVDRLDAVLASHQVSIAQLAIEYCNALVDDENLRDSMFQGFAFTSPVATAWPGVGSASENAFIDPLLDRILGPVGNPIGTQPSRAAVRAELDRLVHGIPGDASRPGLAHTPGAPTGAERTRTIAKAVCSAVVGSAAMLVQ